MVIVIPFLAFAFLINNKQIDKFLLNMSYKFESEVTKALGELLETGANYDVIIHIGEKPNFKEFHAHSIFLSCRSIHFNEILAAKDVEKKDN